MFRSNSVLHPPSPLLIWLARWALACFPPAPCRAPAAPHRDQRYHSCTTQRRGPSVPGISWNPNGGQHITRLCFSSRVWFLFRWFCIADVFPYKHLPEQNFVFSGLHTRLLCALYQALYLSALDGRFASNFQEKKNLVFRRFRLLVSLPLSFTVLMKLFLNYLPWTLNTFHPPPQVVWSALLKSPVPVNFAPFTPCISALYSLTLLTCYPLAWICPLATNIP